MKNAAYLYTGKNDDISLSLIHVALKLRSDVLTHPSYQGFKVTTAAAVESVPDSLHMFLKVLYGGQDVIQTECDSVNNNEDTQNERVLSVGQDIVYGVSNGKKWTPKHIGLGSTLHQATRSKTLVELFNKAGHVITYDNILQVDTALAQATLRSLNKNKENGAIVPENLVSNKFVHFSTDNIDIMDSSLTGKDTFHATQVTAWQRGPRQNTLTLANMKPCTTKLVIPDILIETIPLQRFVGTPEPIFDTDSQLQWFEGEWELDPNIAINKSKDLVFLLRRQQI